MIENQNKAPWMLRIEQMAQEVSQREGCFLYDIEFVGTGQGRVLRVYVDKDGGAGIEDCSNVSKGINLLLDVEDIIPGGAYQLEVSTPGLERHLRKKWHFEKVVGKKIWMRTEEAFENFGVTHARWIKAKQLEDVLQKIENEQLFFTTQEAEISIPLAAVAKAKLVFEMNKGQKNKRG